MKGSDDSIAAGTGGGGGGAGLITALPVRISETKRRRQPRRGQQ
jgi:hypothetical protein